MTSVPLKSLRVRVVLVAALVPVLATVAQLAFLGHEEREPAARPGSSIAPTPESPALVVLHAWDRARARAWAGGDPAALARLYVSGSAAGRADVALLRRYRERGLAVRGMRMQVLRARVVEQSRVRLRLVVTDRLAGGVAVAGATRVRLPGDAAATREIVVRRVAGAWRVAAVRRSGV